MAKNKSRRFSNELQTLQQREKQLFEIYNWRAAAEKKVEILSELIEVINKIDKFKQV